MGDAALQTTTARSKNAYTFLFTDVEGSTRRWQADPDGMAEALANHDGVMHAGVTARGGSVFKNTGDGICAVFPSPTDAVRAAIDVQRALALPVRMAVHTGEALERDGDFFGVALSHCARLMDAGHGGQVLVSESAVSVAGNGFGQNVELQDLGKHRLRDLREPEGIFQVHAPGLVHEFPALRSLELVRHNLPVQRSSFVGRRGEVGEVSELLLGRQLVTLTGIGGCGKTRLALEVAAGLVEHFPQGVFFVDLGLVSDPDLVGQAVAAALGLQLLDTSSDGLVGYLLRRRLLVVLDNCEHLLDSCATLVDDLLARCPDLRVLATSREALGVEGEQAVRVPSLAIDTDAMSLFLDRARAVRPDLQLDTASESTVVEICNRLDGIPLAIELAAARVAHLSPAEILERLSDRFQLLTGGRRRVPRQQTLSAAIDWSHSLLTDDEKVVLRRLAVFRGSFSLSAAEAICDPDALDRLGSLVAKSLVNVEEQDAVTRYRLLETVRLYGEDRLVDAGETEQLRSRHRDWFLGWIEACPVGSLVSAHGAGRAASEADNLAVALDWCRQQGRLDLLVRIASLMVGYWWTEMRIAELGVWWDEIRPARSELPSELRAVALVPGVQHAMAVGDRETMEKLSADALDAAHPDSWVAAWAWAIQALYWTLADPERGRRCIREGQRAADAAGVPELHRMNALYGMNDLLGLGPGDRDEAVEVVDSLAATTTSEGHMDGILIGWLAMLGDTKRASARLAAASAPRTPFQRFSRAQAAALIALGEGRPEAMGEHLRTQATVVRDHAIPLGEESCAIGFAALAIEDGDPARASRLLASVAAAGFFPFRTPLDVAAYGRCLGATRDALDPEAARRSRTEGTAISVREALDGELQRLVGGAHPDRKTEHTEDGKSLGRSAPGT